MNPNSNIDLLYTKLAALKSQEDIIKLQIKQTQAEIEFELAKSATTTRLATVVKPQKCTCGERLCCDYPNIRQFIVVVANNYKAAGSRASPKPCILLAGNDAKQFDLPLFDKKSHCVLGEIRRELTDKFKIEFGSFADFVDYFKNSHGNLIFSIRDDILTLVGVFRGLSRKTINDQISTDNANTNLSPQKHQTKCVDWFEISTRAQLENKPCQISGFASRFLSDRENSSFLGQACTRQ